LIKELKMGLFDNNTLNGNIARIQEMHQGKAGAIKISKAFKKEGMALEPHHVTAIIAAVPELKKKSLKKKTAKAVIKECASTNTATNTGGDLVPEGT
jgi:predicted DNA-binding transcriptional regulator YafY